MSTNTPISHRDRSAARKRMKRAGEKYLVALNHIIAARDERLGRDRLWSNTAAALVSFIREHGRIPSRTGVDLHERMLGYWLLDRRHSASMTTERRSYLDENAPGWSKNESYEEWVAVADELATFIRENGREPERTSDDIHEVQLASWIGHQRVYSRIGSPNFTRERRAYLESHIPDWDGANRNQRSVQTTIEYEKFRTQHGRVPSPDSSDPYEKMLGVWLRNQQKISAEVGLEHDAPFGKPPTDERIIQK